MGPTAWMTCLACRPKPGVILASPAGQGASFAQAAASSATPAARNIAPQTPPPCASEAFAAFTMASTASVVMSRRCAVSGMAASEAERAAILARVAAADQQAALAVDQDGLAAAMRLVHQLH